MKQDVGQYYFNCNEKSAPGFRIALPQKPNWKLDFLGDGHSLQIHITKDVSWFKRFTTKLMFGSKWERLDN